jgi:hypothetical protein
VGESAVQKMNVKFICAECRTCPGLSTFFFGSFFSARRLLQKMTQRYGSSGLSVLFDNLKSRKNISTIPDENFTYTGTSTPNAS